MVMVSNLILIRLLRICREVVRNVRVKIRVDFLSDFW